MKRTDKIEMIRAIVLLGVIFICAFNIKTSYDDIYSIVYDGPTYSEVGLATTDLQLNIQFEPKEQIEVANEYITKAQFMNGLIEALNIVICLIGMTMSFSTMISRYKISLIKDLIKYTEK